LGAGAVWRWYSGSCGGTLVGTGTSISVSPTSATTYFVRAEGTCNTTACVSTSVAVHTNTVANAGPDQAICGTSTNLAANTSANGSGTWSVIGGSGTFANASSPTTSVSGLAVGPNTFRWTLSNGACPTSQDDVVITRDNTPPTIACPAAMSLCADAFCQATLPDFTTTLGTTLIASSQADFNGVQGFRNWYYGEYAAFSANSFTQLPTFTGFVHQAGQAFNTPYLSATGGHPGVNNLSWAVRRWISSFSGTVNLRLRFFDTNTGCGDGANVRVFNGTTQVWDYQGIPGNMQTFDIPVTIACGDRLDFVIDPRFDAGCDDAFFTVEITSANSASATDNCGIASVTQSPAALSSAPVGATPVSLTATDVNGNSASCSFNVTVVDQIAPVIATPPRSARTTAPAHPRAKPQAWPAAPASPWA
jgi:hypothetical protein